MADSPVVLSAEWFGHEPTSANMFKNKTPLVLHVSDDHLVELGEVVVETHQVDKQTVKQVVAINLETLQELTIRFIKGEL
jgi:hypothetical protein